LVQREPAQSSSGSVLAAGATTIDCILTLFFSGVSVVLKEVLATEPSFLMRLSRATAFTLRYLP